MCDRICIMKILAVSDTENKFLWDTSRPEEGKGVDLILSCGDLNPHYLSFIATYTHAPVVCVPGNHDTWGEENPPEGCVNADGRIVKVKGLRILGLGGSVRYKKEGSNQYSQAQMNRRIWGLGPSIWQKRGFDILLTHAPIAGFYDLPDPAHQGFAAFGPLIHRQKPLLMVHGHIHRSYALDIPRMFSYGATNVVNAYDRRLLEVDTAGRKVQVLY